MFVMTVWCYSATASCYPAQLCRIQNPSIGRQPSNRSSHLLKPKYRRRHPFLQHPGVHTPSVPSITRALFRQQPQASGTRLRCQPCVLPMVMLGIEEFTVPF